MSELTDREQRFVDIYVVCLNGSEAMRRVWAIEGFAGKRPDQAAYDYLRNPEIRAAIDARLAESVMPPNEILARLTDQARVSVADFFTVKGRGLTLDLKKAADLGVLHLIKSYKKTRQGTTVEFYDTQAALIQLGKHYGLWTADDDDWRKALAQMGYNAADLFGQLVERLTPPATEGTE